jgi:general secretion pathway protein J
MSRAARGFTLIEVLLATALLVGGLALAFATVRSALAISQRGACGRWKVSCGGACRWPC